MKNYYFFKFYGCVCGGQPSTETVRVEKGFKHIFVYINNLEICYFRHTVFSFFHFRFDSADAATNSLSQKKKFFSLFIIIIT